jgi:S1-C subfamily serine protease
MTLSEAIDIIRPSIVQLSVMNPQSAGSQTFGSGFILNARGHIATAAHVVDSAVQMAQQGLHISVGLAYPNDDGGTTGFTMMNNFHHVSVEVLAIDRDHDVAIIKMQPNPFDDPPRSMIRIGDQEGPRPQYKACQVSLERPRDGESIASSGYPLSSTTLVTTSGALASAWETQIKNVSDGWRTRDSIDVYLADISVNPGNSGGPIYRIVDGFVIGVCTAYRFAPLFYADQKGGQVTIGERPVAINAGLCVVSPIRHIVKLQNQMPSTIGPTNAI